MGTCQLSAASENPFRCFSLPPSFGGIVRSAAVLSGIPPRAALGSRCRQWPAYLRRATSNSDTRCFGRCGRKGIPSFHRHRRWVFSIQPHDFCGTRWGNILPLRSFAILGTHQMPSGVPDLVGARTDGAILHRSLQDVREGA